MRWWRASTVRRLLTIDKVLATLRTHMIDDPLFLPLAARCLGVIQQALGPDVVTPYRVRLARRLERAGAGLERHFAGLAPGGGVDLLRQSFALILGLWQLQAVAKPAAPHAAEGPSRTAAAFAGDVDRALSALWRGALAASSRRADLSAMPTVRAVDGRDLRAPQARGPRRGKIRPGRPCAALP